MVFLPTLPGRRKLPRFQRLLLTGTALCVTAALAAADAAVSAPDAAATLIAAAGATFVGAASISAPDATATLTAGAGAIFVGAAATSTPDAAATTAAAPATPSAADAALTWEELERQGASLAAIEIDIHDVFELSNPEERHWFGFLANALHLKTRESTVADELLFATGVPVRARAVRETERNLRSFPFVRDAVILPVMQNGSCAAKVEVHDAWSLKSSLRFGRLGGASEWAVSVDEVNLLGLGVHVRGGWEETVERSRCLLGYRDPRFFGTRWDIDTLYEELSDGRQRNVSLTRPFYSLETAWSGWLAFSERDANSSFFEDESKVFLYPVSTRNFRCGGSKAVSVQAGTALRLGAGYLATRTRYGARIDFGEPRPVGSAPEDRDLHGLLLTAGICQDRFEVFRNLSTVGRSEDVNLGWEAEAAAGILAPYRELDPAAWIGELQAEKNWLPAPGLLAGLRVAAETLHGRDGWRDAAARARGTLYCTGLRNRVIAATCAFDQITACTPERWLTVGASDGLRGYGNHLLTGDRRWIVQVEDRSFTDIRLWGLVQLGGILYLDAGALRMIDSGRWSRLFADIGAGLRLGNLKSSAGRVILCTVAAPLLKEAGDAPYRLFIGTEVSF